MRFLCVCVCVKTFYQYIFLENLNKNILFSYVTENACLYIVFLSRIEACYLLFVIEPKEIFRYQFAFAYLKINSRFSQSCVGSSFVCCVVYNCRARISSRLRREINQCVRSVQFRFFVRLYIYVCTIFIIHNTYNNSRTI